VVSACASADVPAPSDAEATAEAGGAGADRGEAVPASGRQEADPPATASTPPAKTLEETRLALGKWIETQQVISKERRDWQQGKDILAGRLELAEQEVATLEEKIAQNGASVAEADRKRDELLAEKEHLDAALAQLGVAVAAMEREVRTLFTQIPEPLQRKVQPLYQRIPEDPANTRSTAAERFQNVLGILNELNKANNEITVGYEVHTLADGKPAEVKTIYVGLAQAFYVSGGGESGIGRPGPDGWEWQPAKTASDEILMALEILQGKQTPAFVPLPMKIQ
jgi:hypothetical protein